jgi:hypothetical protein
VRTAPRQKGATPASYQSFPRNDRTDARLFPFGRGVGGNDNARAATLEPHWNSPSSMKQVIDLSAFEVALRRRPAWFSALPIRLVTDPLG